MLGKVMKHEWKAAGRMLLPFFGFSAVLSALLRLMLFLSGIVWEPIGIVLGGLSGSLGILLLLAVVAVTFTVLVVRFYRSMAGREAYLTFTLPVKASAHLWGKFIVAVLYALLSCAVALVCGGIMIPGFGEIVSGQFAVSAPGDLTVNLLPALLSPSHIWSLWGLAAVFILLAIVSNLIHFYASFAIGTQLGPRRLLGSLLGYIILSGIQTIVLLPFIAVPLIANAVKGRVFVSATGGMEARFNAVAASTDAYAGLIMELLWTVVLIFGGAILLFSAAELVLCWYFYGKKLNLE